MCNSKTNNDKIKTFVDVLLEKIRSKTEFNLHENNIDTKALLQIIKFIRSLFENLREYIHNYEFESIDEEIWFFKEGKPSVMSKLIYYNELYRIELGRPHGGKDIIINYYKKRLEHISVFFNEHLDFYKYYRSREGYLDKYYFLRGTENINLNHNYGMFDKDPLFCSCCDYWVAKILANDLLEIYLEQRVREVEKQETIKELQMSCGQAQLRWTGNKVAAIELGYAIYVSGVVNNGNADIKQIMNYIETTLNIDLGDYYRSYLAIKGRKKNRTPFLSTLITKLLAKMDEDDSY